MSGSVAERTKLEAYFMYAVFINAFTYPVVVHWVWGGGWLGPTKDNKPIFSKDNNSNGFIDFAGSGVVHMVGGFSGLVGAWVVGPRKGRFEVLSNGKFGKPLPMPGHSMVLCALGVMILWFGWYGFNCGSTLAVSGSMKIAGKVAVTTTIAGAGACLASTSLTRYQTKKFDLATSLNGVVAGLISITAGCPYVDPWAAFCIGIIGALVYIGSDKILLKLHIDDPLQACALHGFCGMWGCLSVGIFSSDRLYQAGGGSNSNNAFASGEQLAVQLVGVLSIIAWTLGTMFVVFWTIDKTIGMRVSDAEEDEGLDIGEHGAEAYHIEEDQMKRMVERSKQESAEKKAAIVPR